MGSSREREGVVSQNTACHAGEGALSSSMKKK